MKSENNLDGRNTLDDVTIRTGGGNVAIAGTTVDGRRLSSNGSTTQKAVANLEAAAARNR